MQIINWGINMKKIKRALAISSSVMVMSACMILPIYAEEATEPNENQQTEEKITDTAQIKKLIDDYIDKQGYLAGCAFAGDTNVVIVEGIGELQLTEIEESVKVFMKVKNIDETKVEFGVVELALPGLGDANCDYVVNVRDCAYIANNLAKGKAEDYLIYNYYNHYDFNYDGVTDIRDAAAIAKYLVSKPITDPNEIINMLSDFVEKQKFSANLQNDGKIVTVGVNWKVAGTIEPINAFVKRENIDEKLIKYSVLE